MIYPCDATTTPFLVLKNSSLTVLPAGQHTILSSILMPTGLNSAGQAQDIKAGDVYLAFNGSQNIPQFITYFSYKTDSAIISTNSSPTYNVLGQITYVDRNISNSVPACQEYASPILTNNGFTYGEILICFFLFLFMAASVFGFVINKISHQKT